MLKVRQHIGLCQRYHSVLLVMTHRNKRRVSIQPSLGDSPACEGSTFLPCEICEFRFDLGVEFVGSTSEDTALALCAPQPFCEIWRSTHFFTSLSKFIYLFIYLWPHINDVRPQINKPHINDVKKQRTGKKKITSITNTTAGCSPFLCAPGTHVGHRLSKGLSVEFIVSCTRFLQELRLPPYWTLLNAFSF